MTTSKIRILGSGSSGNCILVYDSRGKCAMLDMGLSWDKDIKPAMDYDISCLSIGCCGHVHSDHSKSLSHIIKSGIPCYANKDVCERYKGCHLLEGAKRVDGWKVQTFELVHSVPNNAFVLDTYDGIRILYCTDTQRIPKIVRGVHYAIIECNHDLDLVVDNLCEGNHNMSHYENHHSLERCIDYLKKIYSSDLQAVILCHISETNGDPSLFENEVKSALGFSNVFAAEKNLEIPLNFSEF